MNRATLLLILLLFQTVFAESLNFNGKVHLDAFHSVGGEKDSEIQQLFSEIWFSGNKQTGQSKTTFTLIHRWVDKNLETDANSQNENILREAYWNYNDKQWATQIGKIIYRWGVNDDFSPTDVWISHDTRYLLLMERGYQSPVIINISYRPYRKYRRCIKYRKIKRGKKIKRKCLKWQKRKKISNYTFELVATPYPSFNKTSYAIISEATPLINMAPEELPEKKLANSEIGGKIKYNGPGVDASVMIFSGINHSPVYEEKNRTMTTLDIAPRFKKYNAIGFDYATSFDWGTFNFEGIYRDYHNSSFDPTTINTHYEIVTSMEIRLNENYRCQFYFLSRLYPDHKIPSEARDVGGMDAIAIALAELNSVFLESQKPNLTKTIARLSWENEETDFLIDYLSIYSPSNKDYFFNLEFTFNLSDSIEISSGGSIWGGGQNTLFGTLKNYNGIYFKTTAWF